MPELTKMWFQDRKRGFGIEAELTVVIWLSVGPIDVLVDLRQRVVDHLEKIFSHIAGLRNLIRHELVFHLVVQLPESLV